MVKGRVPVLLPAIKEVMLQGEMSGYEIYKGVQDIVTYKTTYLGVRTALSRLRKAGLISSVQTRQLSGKVKGGVTPGLRIRKSRFKIEKPRSRLWNMSTAKLEEFNVR